MKKNREGSLWSSLGLHSKNIPRITTTQKRRSHVRYGSHLLLSVQIFSAKDQFERLLHLLNVIYLELFPQI